MAESSPRPFLKSILHLRKAPKAKAISVRGKSVQSVQEHRLAGQRKILSETFRKMDKTVANQPNFSGRAVVYAAMFEDSLAKTYTPDDLFNLRYGAQLITPHRTGYLIEMQVDYLARLADQIERSDQGKEMVDISRVQSVAFFNEKNATADRTLDALWEEASKIETARAFIIWFMPFQSESAQKDLIQKISTLQNEIISSPPSLLQEIIANLGTNVSTAMRQSLQTAASESDQITLAMRDYQEQSHAYATVIIPSKMALGRLLESGTVFRIDPVSPITSTTPGSEMKPIPPLQSDMSGLPIVGVVDGGLTASSYRSAEAWRAPSLVPDKYAETEHGNQVTSLIVQGHEWNKHLKLPALYCQVGTAQVAPKQGAPSFFNLRDFVIYLDALMYEHTNTRVWNFSLNLKKDCPLDSVNPFSHSIAELARKHKILPIISIGNKPGDRLRPPADCEAAITVGGRRQNIAGNPAGKCDVSLKGPGPSNMLKPELSNFSTVHTIGGENQKGSSFATALISPVAAHTMARLRDPSPDLVKALLLHSADLDKFDPNLGFGTPTINPLPWLCRPGVVTLQWTEKLRPNSAFYWELPIPPSLQKTGKLRGFGILTAILNPHPMVSVRAGMNYFSARIQTALQYQTQNSDSGFRNLLGGPKTELQTEQRARKQDHKWSPVRHHKKSFSHGIQFKGNNLRVYARLFCRDPYLYKEDSVELIDTAGLDTVFVLSIGVNDGSDDIYDEMRNELGTSVEVAVIDSDIDIGDR